MGLQFQQTQSPLEKLLSARFAPQTHLNIQSQVIQLLPGCRKSKNQLTNLSKRRPQAMCPIYGDTRLMREVAHHRKLDPRMSPEGHQIYWPLFRKVLPWCHPKDQKVQKM